MSAPLLLVRDDSCLSSLPPLTGQELSWSQGCEASSLASCVQSKGQPKGTPTVSVPEEPPRRPLRCIFISFVPFLQMNSKICSMNTREWGSQPASVSGPEDRAGSCPVLASGYTQTPTPCQWPQGRGPQLLFLQAL